MAKQGDKIKMISAHAKKIRKEGLATIIAEWKNEDAESEPIIIKVTPEMVLKILKKK